MSIIDKARAARLRHHLRNAHGYAIHDGDDTDEDFAVPVTSDRPTSRNRSAVDLFPDAVWL